MAIKLNQESERKTDKAPIGITEKKAKHYDEGARQQEFGRAVQRALAARIHMDLNVS